MNNFFGQFGQCGDIFLEGGIIVSLAKSTCFNVPWLIFLAAALMSSSMDLYMLLSLSVDLEVSGR